MPDKYAINSYLQAVSRMTRISIHGGQVDVMCACGQPKMYTEPLKYGFRLMFTCEECHVSFALDVIA